MRKTWFVGVLVFLIIALIISLCFNFKLQNSQTSEKRIQTVSFERKQECSKYKDRIENEFKQDNASETSIEFRNFEKIFYSSTEESCLYVYSSQFGLKAADRYKTLYLVDALSGENLSRATIIEEGKYSQEAESAFITQLKEYGMQ